MKKYSITIEEKANFYYEIHAENQEIAEEEALKKHEINPSDPMWECEDTIKISDN
ncbi:hypothetical protein LRR18_16980 [Mangrovimonas sp. AS39]|uniref:hypothetical protein n=1 Tax=Mangrovimonas futianensis TaxID=2895523 RepID=UPI001E434087|nr:hypothetical protein [Mangrovimonas futianensis]MCF1193286.1 hypothetical protein [Mangrovimonas futianensis]